MAFPTGYSKYQVVTIDHTKVAADLTDADVYINLADMVKAGADIFDTCRSDGGDIRVTKSDGTTQLAAEVATINTTSKVGDLYFKFTGTLSSSTDTDVWIWYNGTDTALASTDTYGRNNVWTNYTTVFHFKEGSGTTATNSTGGTNGTLSGAGLWNSDSPYGVSTGLLADATNYVSSGVSGTHVNYTLSFWGYINDPAGTQNAQMFTGAQLPSPTRLLSNYFDDGNAAASRDTYREYRNGTQALYQTTGTLDTWHHRVQTSQKNTTGGLKAYRNGSLLGSANTANADLVLSTNELVILGHNNNGTKSATVNPYRVSEWRFSSTAQSANWLLTTYRNQSSSSTFYSVSDQQGGGGSTANPAFLLAFV